MRSNRSQEDFDERVAADMEWMAQQQQQQQSTALASPLITSSFGAINSTNISTFNTFDSRAHQHNQQHTSEQQECLTAYSNNLHTLYKGLLSQLMHPKDHHGANNQASYSTISP